MKTASNIWYVVSCVVYTHIHLCYLYLLSCIYTYIAILLNNTGSVDMLKEVVVVLVLLLILAGDVELNPGPGKCELYF